LQACNTGFPAKFNSFRVTQQNYAENKKNSLKIMKIKMYAILDNAKPHAENIKGLDLAVVMCITVQVP
jgi:hypothetical protein